MPFREIFHVPKYFITIINIKLFRLKIVGFEIRKMAPQPFGIFLNILYKYRCYFISSKRLINPQSIYM